VESFLGKLRHSPLEIKICGFLKPNFSFLAAALPNVITYLIVLIQFKQADQNLAVSKNSNSTNG